MVQHGVYPMIICMRCITVIELHLKKKKKIKKIKKIKKNKKKFKKMDLLSFFLA
jgi:hypothetical protein